MSRTLLCAVATGMLLAGCSTNDANKDAGTQADQGPPRADLNLADVGAGCGPGLYPCGPYGTNKGDVVENEIFVGYTDPDWFCKTYDTHQVDIKTKTRISFSDFYRTPAKCPDKKRKLLWVNVAAGWCGPCYQEIDSTIAQYRAGKVDAKIALLNIVFEDADRAPATEKWVETNWYPRFKFPYPVVLDPSFKMGKYFSKAAVPFNMLVDLSTMKVWYRQTGGALDTIGQQIAAFLNQ